MSAKLCLPVDPCTQAVQSMKKLGVSNGQLWGTAREVLCKELLENGVKNIHHVFQAISGKQVDCDSIRCSKWYFLLGVPVYIKSKILILRALDTMAASVC